MFESRHMRNSPSPEQVSLMFFVKKSICESPSSAIVNQLSGTFCISSAPLPIVICFLPARYNLFPFTYHSFLLVYLSYLPVSTRLSVVSPFGVSSKRHAQAVCSNLIFLFFNFTSNPHVTFRFILPWPSVNFKITKIGFTLLYCRKVGSSNQNDIKKIKC